MTTTKPKTCRQCKSRFYPARPMQVACSPMCALEIGRLKTEQEKIKAAAADRKVTRQKLDAMQTKPQLVAKAQTAFNGFIRARDEGKGCISCGTFLTSGGVGGGFDCGHYRSVGSAVHMRFVEDNAHGQCKHCNRYLSGNYVEYRKSLLDRIGERLVELIEADQTLRRYTKEGLVTLAKYYNAAARTLKEKA
jgi:hypothetical protein